ncbi:tyrosine-type recombinase/integrase [Agrobacterium vaccinii]|uniref:tyrosine-type recombinase/integrase n=1 Tax=Agrobacterium vaccinii TaxID=2735528 RepID=UPI001E38D49B|nr:tyrosine-type recombinase/integrase [Agrobacterium vaccinii]UHS56289.1 tyrosine-type recombinase/integrase [Agrobacterium vaccinii]
MLGVKCLRVDNVSDWNCIKGQRGVHPRIVPGIKILIDSDFNPLSDMNEFTLKPADRKRRAGKSWLNTQNAYADDLYQYKVFLIAVELDEADVTLADLEDYGSCFLGGISIKTRQKFKISTAYRRHGTAVRYHKQRIFWGLPSSVSLNELTSQGGFRDGIIRSDPDSPYAWLPKDVDAADKIHPILNGSWMKIFECLGPAPEEKNEAARRDRLASETSLITGMRIDEVCSLTVQQIINLERHVDPEQPSKLIPLQITKTKGLKPGFVYLPSFLVEQMLKYIRVERQVVIDRAQKVRGNFEQTQNLFVSDLRSNYTDAGNPLTADTLSRRFTRACIAAGMYSSVYKHVLDEAGNPLLSASGENVVTTDIVADHTFHDLRHTFAMLTYQDCARSGKNEPWKTVQVRLRHESILTTLRSYLRWLDRIEETLSDNMMRFFGMIDTIGRGLPA